MPQVVSRLTCDVTGYKLAKLLDKTSYDMCTFFRLASVIMGLSMLRFSVIFGEFYRALAMTDADEAIALSNALCLAILLLGILFGAAQFIQTYMYNKAGIYLTTRIR